MSEGEIGVRASPQPTTCESNPVGAFGKWIALLTISCVLWFNSAGLSAEDAPTVLGGADVVGAGEPTAALAQPVRAGNPCKSQPGRGPEMILIEAGRFSMGSPDDESGRDSDEGPRHEVTIVRPLAIARCETTVGEFRRFVTETEHVVESIDGKGCFTLNEAGTDVEQRKDRDWRNPGFAQTDAHPVVCVGWNDAVAYAEWLSARTGVTYRLPTEAEWEYAARAGTRARWSFGNEESDLGEYGWYWENSEGKTHPVGEKVPNPWGLQDVHGNVWEWVRDCWAVSYENALADGSARESGDCAVRVVRGGGWDFKPGDLRSATRDRSGPDEASGVLGFRLARDL